ncbi:MAG: pseudouridine-5'-phosphate glycosidase [Chloracidobacterium sp.]|nr:pseudouridine-5'-phosphate glycosidase [Chloracidobacterium sp.]MCC6825388.1 pseudouridine-5'-phosphate glycosidase [Acidobacteriota bacterium]MCO5333199.1 pseudouridine-5'-phosphate glycosidase [Pyrinomonadaceae bacterium]
MDPEFGNEAADAKENGRPLVALESTVISHGLPYPRNLETARALEEAVRSGGAVPATIAVLNGQIRVGISDKELEFLAAEKDIRKISRRDIPVAIARKLNCATTVATTSFFANAAGIKVFATGGIGGVHRGYDKDISADLPELAQTPIVVVCSGAKIVLDLPATREWLETNGVTVLGWQCDELPAFYSRTSGLSIDERVESADDVARIAEARDAAGLRNAILVTVPVPKASELERAEVEGILADAMALADERGIRGKDITPFLLSEMSSRSGGRTLTANIELLKNNAGVAAEIACAMKS